MGISDLTAAAFHGVSAKLNGFTAKVKRNAILCSIGAVFAVGAIIFASSASVLALEPHVGMVYARLILAGLFAAIVIAVAVALWLGGRTATTAARAVPLHTQAQTAQRAQFAQLAMIVEAVLLGYSMSRRR